MGFDELYDDIHALMCIFCGTIVLVLGSSIESSSSEIQDTRSFAIFFASSEFAHGRIIRNSSPQSRPKNGVFDDFSDSIFQIKSDKREAINLNASSQPS